MINKIKTISTIFIIILSFKSSFSQNIDYNYIIIPEGAQDLTVEERLVQLAWKNNPVSNINNNNIQIAKHNLTLAQTSWLDNIVITGNVNEFVISPESDEFNRAQFFPLYNIGARISLGELIINPQKAKIARVEYENEMERLNQQKLFIRAEVLRRYNAYTSSQAIMEIQSEKTENALNTFNLVEEQFLNGNSPVETYNAAYNNYKNEQIELERLENDVRIAKVNLEELIGVDVETIIN